MPSKRERIIDESIAAVEKHFPPADKPSPKSKEVSWERYYEARLIDELVKEHELYDNRKGGR